MEDSVESVGTLVVMAAGAGSRFGGPKQSTPVGPAGEWLLEYAVFDALRAGFGRVVLIIREEHAEVFERRVRQVMPDVPVTLAFQRPTDLPDGHQVPAGRVKPWGTGHAVLSARSVVDGPFAIMNADDFYGAEAYREGARAARVAAADGTATVVAMRLRDTLSPHGEVKRGWCQTADDGGAAGDCDRVVRIQEVMGLERRGDGLIRATGAHAGLTFDGSERVSMNFWVFPSTIFALLLEDFRAFLRTSGTSIDAEHLLPEAVNTFVARGALRVRVVDAPGPWFGLTHRDDASAVTDGLLRLTRSGVYPSPLWSRRP
jgi:hypothetical protein